MQSVSVCFNPYKDEKPNLNGCLNKKKSLYVILWLHAVTWHKPHKKSSPFAPHFCKGLENFLFYLSFSNTCFSTLVVQTQLVFWLRIYCNSSLSKSPLRVIERAWKSSSRTLIRQRADKNCTWRVQKAQSVCATDERLHHMANIIQRWGFVLWNKYTLKQVVKDR